MTRVDLDVLFWHEIYNKYNDYNYYVEKRKYIAYMEIGVFAGKKRSILKIYRKQFVGKA